MKQRTEKNIAPRVVSVFFAVIIMGFALSWLVLVDMGTDPYTALNLAISRKLSISVGNWQAILNIALIAVVFFCDRQYIGIGTVANMFLVGYSLDFFLRAWSRVLPGGLPGGLPVRLLVLAPALFLFVVAAAVYMDVQLGTSPYDALAFILADRIRIAPIKAVRIVYDLCIIAGAFFLGESVGLVTLLIALTLGPVIGFVGEILDRKLPMLRK